MKPKYTSLSKESYRKIYDLNNNARWLLESDKQDALIDLWNLLDSGCQQEMIVDLLERFIYLKCDGLEKSILKIKECILTKWNTRFNLEVHHIVYRRIQPGLENSSTSSVYC